MADNPTMPLSTDAASRHRYPTWTIFENSRSKPDVLLSSEIWWRDHQSLMEQRPDRLRCGRRRGILGMLEDNRPVMLKGLFPGLGSTADELAIHRYLQSDDLALHPDNHTALLLDVLQVPDGEMEHIIVLPLLRPYHSPEFGTTAEAMDFIEQTLKGLRFMHTRGVAHGLGSTTLDNIMMDATAMYPDGFHPANTRMRPDMSGSAAYYSRSQRPVTDYFTDFRRTRRYPTASLPLVSSATSEDRSESEQERPLLPQDPFAADIYTMGRRLRTDFPNAHFLAPLVADVTKPDPAARPTIDDVVARFADVCSVLNPMQLALPIVRADENPLDTVLRSLTVLGRVAGQAVYGSVAF